jgi:hypothetical protein
MCLVKKPKIPNSSDAKKDPPVLRNPYLDGMLGNIAALRGSGRNALRIDLLDPLMIPVGGSAGGGFGGGGGGGGSTGGSTSSGGSSGGGGTSGGGGGGNTLVAKL